MSSIKVSKDYPASFVLELEKDDIVEVFFKKNSGRADLQKLEVQIIDLNQQEAVVMQTFKRSGRNFLASYEGTYRVDFIYKGKGSGLLKERSLDLSLQIELEDYEGIKEGESKEVLHTTNVVIQEGEASALKVVYYLTKGDKITVSSTDKKSAFLKLNITQQPKILSIQGSTVINIMSDGTYTFNFYLDEDDEGGSLLNLKDLLSKDDLLFRDLSIYRERAVDFSALNSTSTTVENKPNESGDLFDDSSNGDDAENENGFDFEAFMESSNQGTADARKDQNEFNKQMLELMNKKRIRTTISAFGESKTLFLEPELNFAAKRDLGHRQCEVLRVTNTDVPVWFYWVGVGEKAEEAFELHNSYVAETFKKTFGDAVAEHIYGKMSKSQAKRRNPGYPDERKYQDFLNEDAEYAIVDFENKEKFMKGDRVQRLNKPDRNAKYITSDSGISYKAANEGDMFFCACNNNKSTPVTIFLKYFVIDADEQEY